MVELKRKRERGVGCRGKKTKIDRYLSSRLPPEAPLSVWWCRGPGSLTVSATPGPGPLPVPQGLPVGGPVTRVHEVVVPVEMQIGPPTPPEVPVTTDGTVAEASEEGVGRTRAGPVFAEPVTPGRQEGPRVVPPGVGPTTQTPVTPVGPSSPDEVGPIRGQTPCHLEGVLGPGDPWRTSLPGPGGHSSGSWVGRRTSRQSTTY